MISRSHTGLHADSAEPAWDSLSLPLSLPPSVSASLLLLLPLFLRKEEEEKKGVELRTKHLSLIAHLTIILSNRLWGFQWPQDTFISGVSLTRMLQEVLGALRALSANPWAC